MAMKTMPNIQGQGISMSDLRSRKEKNLDAFDKAPGSEQGSDTQVTPTASEVVAPAPNQPTPVQAAPVQSAPVQPSPSGPAASTSGNSTPTNKSVETAVEPNLEASGTSMSERGPRLDEPARAPSKSKKVEFPWDNLTAWEEKTIRNQHFSISLATEMKIDWIKKRVPEMTRARFMRQAVEKAADDMIAHLRRKGIE